MLPAKYAASGLRGVGAGAGWARGEGGGGVMMSVCGPLSHTPSTAFRHLPPTKDVVNQCLEFATELVDHEPAYTPPSPWGFYHMVISGYLDHQSAQFRLSASELLLFVSQCGVGSNKCTIWNSTEIAMTLSLSSSFIMTKKSISIYYFIV